MSRRCLKIDRCSPINANNSGPSGTCFARLGQKCVLRSRRHSINVTSVIEEEEEQLMLRLASCFENRLGRDFDGRAVQQPAEKVVATRRTQRLNERCFLLYILFSETVFTNAPLLASTFLPSKFNKILKSLNRLDLTYGPMAYGPMAYGPMGMAKRRTNSYRREKNKEDVSCATMPACMLGRSSQWT